MQAYSVVGSALCNAVHVLRYLFIVDGYWLQVLVLNMTPNTVSLLNEFYGGSCKKTSSLVTFRFAVG